MSEVPSVSVIVPTFRRPGELTACLKALAGLDYPRDRLEVIVVDDGGDIPLDGVVAPFRERFEVELIRQQNAGPAAARNAGASRARGEILAFTDDDCAPDPSWLRTLVEGPAAEPGCAAGGRTVNALESNPYATTSQLVTDLVYAHYNVDPGEGRFLASNNFALGARAFRSIGGFDERFRVSEDRELCDRWRHAGRRLVYVPEAVVRHSHVLTFGGFCEQHFAYGRGAFRFHRVRGRRGSGHLMTELAFYRGLPHATRASLAGIDDGRAALGGLLALWQAANAVGYVWEAASSGLRR